MENKPIFLFLLSVQLIIHSNNLAAAQQPQPNQVTAQCRNTGDFKSDALLKQRDAALEDLSKNLKSPQYSGFKSTRTGTNPGDLVNAIALCPPNIKPESCEICIKKSTPILKQKCPKQKEVVIWTILTNIDSCMVRYSDFRIEGKYEDWGWTVFSSPQTGADRELLDKALYNLTKKLVDQVVDGSDGKKYASGDLTYGQGFTKVYAALQCTPDISKDECRKCLLVARMGLENRGVVKGKMSARMLGTNCYARYAHDMFWPKSLTSSADTSGN